MFICIYLFPTDKEFFTLIFAMACRDIDMNELYIILLIAFNWVALKSIYKYTDES